MLSPRSLCCNTWTAPTPCVSNGWISYSSSFIASQTRLEWTHLEVLSPRPICPSSISSCCHKQTSAAEKKRLWFNLWLKGVHKMFNTTEEGPEKSHHSIQWQGRSPMHQFRLSLLHQELLYEDFSFSETFMYSIFMLYTIVHYRLTCVMPRYFWEAYDASLSTTADGSLYVEHMCSRHCKIKTDS